LYRPTMRGYDIAEGLRPLLSSGIEPQHLSEVLRCKWMRKILAVLLSGPLHPSQLIQKIPGISWKVCCERLRKLVSFGMVRREIIPSTPGRVRYELTRAGRLIAYWLASSQDVEWSSTIRI